MSAIKSKKKSDGAKAGNFRFKKSGKDFLITNDSGDWCWLDPADFRRFSESKLEKGGKLYQELSAKGFVDVDKKKMAALAGRYLDMNRSLAKGTSLFIIVLTLRCNHRCLYCQVIPEKKNTKGFDMTQATAKKTVDLIFRTPSPSVRIEFQGGEPLLNWLTLRYIVKYAKEVNQKKKKDLQISLVSNLTLMDDKKLKFLLDEGVGISCSFDGPAKVHDKNRIYLEGGSSHQVVIRQIAKIKQAIKKRKKENPDRFVDELNGILTVSRFSLAYPKEIVDEYRLRGFNNVFIRPLSPFGLEPQTRQIIGYSAEEFLAFYKKSLDYILRLNSGGERFVERNAYFILRKLMDHADPNYLEMRSPCGAGIGQMAFDYDGQVYTCDEGRMAVRMGHSNFKIGEVAERDYDKLVDNEVVKTMCVASCLDNHVSCQSCAYKPFCGICPLANFVEYGTIFPQLSTTDKCKINKGIFDYLFDKLKNRKYRKIFESWLALKVEAEHK